MAIAPVSNLVTRWSLQESRATRSVRFTSRCPTGERFSIIPSRWLSQSSCFSKPGITGCGELMPWRVAFHLTTALPWAVLGPPASLSAIIRSFLLPSVLNGDSSSQCLRLLPATVRLVHQRREAILGSDLDPLAAQGIVQSYPIRILAPPDHQTTPASLLQLAPPSRG